MYLHRTRAKSPKAIESLYFFQATEFTKATVVTTVDTTTAPLEEVYFPAVTICNINQVIIRRISNVCVTRAAISMPKAHAGPSRLRGTTTNFPAPLESGTETGGWMLLVLSTYWWGRLPPDQGPSSSFFVGRPQRCRRRMCAARRPQSLLPHIPLPSIFHCVLSIYHSEQGFIFFSPPIPLSRPRTDLGSFPFLRDFFLLFCSFQCTRLHSSVPSARQRMEEKEEDANNGEGDSKSTSLDFFRSSHDHSPHTPHKRQGAGTGGIQ